MPSPHVPIALRVAAAGALLSPLLLVALAPSPARADEKNPAVEACTDKQEGDACMLQKLVKPEDGGSVEKQMQPGVCRTDKCCDLDYSKGSPPQTTCSACLACKPGPADTEAPGTDDDETKDATEPPRVGDEPPAQSGQPKRGCAIADRGVPGWAALGLPLLLAISRRRRACWSSDRGINRSTSWAGSRAP